MRRGLISWSREEVSEQQFDARVARLQARMRAEAMDAVLAYTAFDRPAAVSWLTHFVPYWNEALLAVFPSGAPVMLASFSKRMHPWIREVCRVGEILGAPGLGRTAAGMLEERVPGAARIGVINRDLLPWSVAEPIVGAVGSDALVDATGMFASIRQPSDAAEIRLAEHAARIAAHGFESIPRDAAKTSEVLATMERAARLDGAEEVLLRIAPDLARSAVLQRIEGDSALGTCYAVECSLAYKATWIRLTRSRGAAAPSWTPASQWLREAVATIDEAGVAAGPAHRTSAPGQVAAWAIEACVDSHPLSVISAGGTADAAKAAAAGGKLPAGSLATLSLRLELADGPWLASLPLLVGAAGEAARALNLTE